MNHVLDADSDRRPSLDGVLLWVTVCLGLGLACFLLSSRAASVGAQDFREFYTAGRMVLHCPSLLFDVDMQKQWQHAAAGGNQLVTFEHPAYEALFYAPLSLLKFRTAYLIYAACNLLLLWLCYLFAPPALSAFARTYRPALFFLSFPILLAIFVGQNSILFLLATCLGCRALAMGKDWIAGLIFGLAIFKLPVTVPLALLLSIRRGRTFLAGFLCTSAGCALLSVYLTGLSGTRNFLHLLASATLSNDHSLKAQLDSAIWLHSMPNLAGLLYLLGSGRLSPHGFNALNLAATFVVLCACVWLERKAVSDSTAVAAALVCAVLVSPHLYIYDLSIIPLAFLQLSTRWLKPIALLWFLLPPVLYAISFPYLMWFAPAVVVPVLLLVVCFSRPREEDERNECAAETVRLHQ